MGAGQPGHWLLSAKDLAGIESADVLTLERTGEPLPAAPPVLSVDEAAVQEYLDAYDACPDRPRAVEQLTVETWLLARARKLHAKYRARRAGRSEETDAERAHLHAWDKVVEQTYLAHRRVARGRAEPPGLVDRLREALAADRTIFRAGPAVSPAPDDDALRDRVAAVAGAVLGVPAGDLLTGAPLDSFASFSSFRLIEIIERLESELEREFDADLLIPENLRRVDDLCRLAR